jgi:formate hydrogenlyase subunit 6/NADH:ubiquinone oxidoreductase subunit I
MIVRDKNYHYLVVEHPKDCVKCELCHKIYIADECEIWEHSRPRRLEKELTMVKPKSKQRRSK